MPHAMSASPPAAPAHAPRPARLPIALGWLGVAVGAAYLVWRAGWTVNGDALWLSVPLLAAEVWGYATFLLFFFMARDVRPPRRPAAPPGLTVDLYIPTYDEPYEVLALTVAGALAVRHPHATYVLDDGRRPWVERLCAELGARYIARPDTAGAKAGNLNHALGLTAGDVIGVVDADFVPAPGFIDELLGYFADPAVAVVQAPQAFYNTDSFQHAAADDAWHEQLLFYDVIQPGKNRHNAAFWSGSPSLVRRSALASVGGVRTETVTEDLHTSLKLHEAGWATVYHPGVVALGLAPEDFDGFIGQRLRWAQGAMQVIRREWRSRRLSLAQRLNYIASTGTYFDAYRKAIMLLVVPAVLLGDRLPIAADVWLFFAMWALQFAALTAANAALGRGRFRPFHTELFDLMKMFAFIAAGPTLLSSRPLRFAVTPKGRPGERRLHPFLAPFGALLALYAVAVAVGVARLGGWGVHAHNPAAMLGAVIWGVGLTAMLATVTARGYRHVTRRRAFRIPVRLPATLATADGRRLRAEVRDVTLAGLACALGAPLGIGEPVTVAFEGADLALAGVVRSARPDGARGVVAGVALLPDESARARFAALLAAALFDPDHRDHSLAPHAPAAAGRAA